MKKTKNDLIDIRFMIMFLTINLLVLTQSRAGYSFHEGSVGYCEGCHDLHGSSKTVQGEDNGFSHYMLKGSDPSSTCLMCHSVEGSFNSVFSEDGSRYTPGGDFYWLKKTFTSDSDGNYYQSEGDNHGHNVIAVDYGLTEDRVLTAAPGGIYKASAMGCNSCHNPHGTSIVNADNGGPVSVSGSYGEAAPEGTIAGNYRLLGGIGYNGGAEGGITFTSSAPVALANPQDWTESDLNHTAYGEGMTEWCGNCHTDLLTAKNKHPAGSNAKLSGTVVSNYNSYIRTGDGTGNQATSYMALVPFEIGTSDISRLDPSSTSGPDTDGKANVMCLTCHRAHASAFQNIGRWDFRATFIADSHPQSGDDGVTGNDILNSYYGRDIDAEYGAYQRQFCNKCHLQD